MLAFCDSPDRNGNPFFFRWLKVRQKRLQRREGPDWLEAKILLLLLKPNIGKTTRNFSGIILRFIFEK